MLGPHAPDEMWCETPATDAGSTRVSAWGPARVTAQTYSSVHGAGDRHLRRRLRLLPLVAGKAAPLGPAPRPPPGRPPGPRGLDPAAGDERGGAVGLLASGRRRGRRPFGRFRHPRIAPAIGGGRSVGGA